MTPSALLAALRDRGFVVAAVGGKLAVRPASELTPADRAAIVTHLPGLVAAAGRGVSSTADDDNRVAVRLLTDADTLVEQLGVSGTRPEVVAAAGVVCRSYATGDLATVRFAVAEFERVVRGLAATGEGFRAEGPTDPGHLPAA